MIGTDQDLPDDFEQAIASGIRPGDLYVASSVRHGRGVFAARDFAAETIIEICPIIFIPVAQRPTVVNDTVLDDYCYEWDGAAGLALGFGSLYNHSYEPNAYYRKRECRQAKVMAVLEFKPASRQLVTQMQRRVGSTRCSVCPGSFDDAMPRTEKVVCPGRLGQAKVTLYFLRD